MAAEDTTNIVMLDRGALLHALGTERVRVGHYREELAHATDRNLRRRYSRQLDACLKRAAALALALVDMGEAVPVTDLRTEFDVRLLDAMDLAIRHGMHAVARDRARRARPARVGARFG